MSHAILARKSEAEASSSTHDSSKALPGGLKVNKPGDTFEQEADRVADKISAGSKIPAWSFSKVSADHIQRQTPPPDPTQQPSPQPNNYKEGAEKLGEAFLKTDVGKKLEDAATQDPLVKGATDFVGTLPGKIIVGAAATGVVAGLAAEHKALPVQIPEIPLDKVAKGLKVKITYEGPVDRPTKGMITFSYTPGGDKKKKGQSDSDRIRADTARLTAEREQIEAHTTYPPGSPQDLEQKSMQKAIEDVTLHRGGMLPGTGGVPLKPGGVVQQAPGDVPAPGLLQQQLPDTGLHLPKYQSPFAPKTPTLLDKQLELKPITSEPAAADAKKKEDLPVQRKADGNASPAKTGDLQINEPGDSFEREADRAADEAMSSAQSGPQWSLSQLGPGPVQRCSCGGSSAGGGECDECREKKSVQRKATGPAATEDAPGSVHDVLHTAGDSPDSATRQFFENRFGRDFSNIRIHHDSLADRAARDVSATAFTVGSHIVFRDGSYSPETASGRRLMAHELSHTIQQGQAPMRPSPSRDPGESSEIPAYGPGPVQRRRKTIARPPAVLRARNLVQRSIGDKPAAPPNAATRLTPEELLKEVLKQRGYTNRAPQPLLPEGERGPNLGHGVDTHAVIQISDKDGKVVVHELGGHLIGDKSIERSARELVPKEAGEKGKVHGERMALARAEIRLADVDVRGGTLEVVVDQLPCGPDKKDCLGELLDFAERKGLKPKIYVSDEFGHLAPDNLPPDLTRQFRTYSPKGAAQRAFREHGTAGESAPTGSAKVLQIWPPGETPGTPVPRAVPEIPAVDPMNPAPKAGGLSEALGDEGLAKRGTTAAATEGAEIEALSVRGAGAGMVGELALGAASIAIDLVLLVTLVLWELLIQPMIDKFVHEQQEAKRKELQKQIQEKFNFYKAKNVERIVAACYLPKLRQLEKAGKKGYVRTALNIVFQDTSNQSRQPLFGPDTPPESIFDIEVDDVTIADVQLHETDEKPTVGPMTRCDSCGTFGSGKTVIAGYPLWTQQVSFSFEAPLAADLAKDLPKDQKEDDLVNCVANFATGNCFIATACYGSPDARQVETLRRFRDRVLIPSKAGRRFVILYYRVSPPIAEWLTSRPFARRLVRHMFIGPLVFLIHQCGWDRIEPREKMSPDLTQQSPAGPRTQTWRRFAQVLDGLFRLA